MNPLTNIKNLSKLIDNELKLGSVGTKKSWHNQYRDSAWCFFGGMPFELTEGDLICIFSQFGEVVNINLIRDKKTGKSKGFGFVCYENQLSTDLAVDNFNGAKILGRVIRVDHAGNYRPPKDYEDADEITKFLRESGCQGDLSKQIEKDNEKNKPLNREIKVEDEFKTFSTSFKEKELESHSKSSKKDKRYRSRSRSKSRSRSRDRRRDRERDKDRERYKDNNSYHGNHQYRGRDEGRNRHHSSKR